jgi:hypothetical protein
VSIAKLTVSRMVVSLDIDLLMLVVNSCRLKADRVSPESMPSRALETVTVNNRPELQCNF